MSHDSLPAQDASAILAHLAFLPPLAPLDDSIQLVSAVPSQQVISMMDRQFSPIGGWLYEYLRGRCPATGKHLATCPACTQPPLDVSKQALVQCLRDELTYAPVGTVPSPHRPNLVSYALQRVYAAAKVYYVMYQP